MLHDDDGRGLGQREDLRQVAGFVRVCKEPQSDSLSLNQL